MTLEDLCILLKQKREERGLTIEQVVEKTKLYPSAIRDIEEANVSAINPTYLKGFLKIYASYLGIPIENALDEISSLSKTKKEKKEKKTKPEYKTFTISPQVKKIVIGAVAGFLLLWMLVSVTRFIGSHLPRVSKRPVKNMTEVATSNITVPKTIAHDVNVSLTAKRNCYIRVRADGKVMFVGTLSRGRVESWKASKEVEFRISDGSAVLLEVNGKSLPPLTSMHKAIKSLKVTPSGISVSK